jgi:SAM-dependent methyltransferase
MTVQTVQSHWTRDNVLEHFKQRTLESSCPPLIAHLYPGATVLDAGCGPGGLSLDIAARSAPGALTGVDIEATSIAQARALADAKGVANITFEVGDVTRLHFADNTFDITLAVHVLPYLSNPTGVLAEWRRVTRPGGKVIANLGDLDLHVYYPPCPARQRCLAAFAAHQWGEGTAASQGRRSVEIFALAGLRDIKVEPYAPPEFLLYPGETRFEFIRHRLAAPIGEGYQVVVDAGLVDAQTIAEADREGEAWLAHPYAFFAQIVFLVSGTVPTNP